MKELFEKKLTPSVDWKVDKKENDNDDLSDNVHVSSTTTTSKKRKQSKLRVLDELHFPACLKSVSFSELSRNSQIHLKY